MEISASFVFALFCSLASVGIAWGMQKAKADYMNEKISRLEADIKEIQKTHVTSEELKEVKDDLKEIQRDLRQLLSIFSQRFSDKDNG